MTDLYYEPVFYGICDETIPADGGDFGARIYFPVVRRRGVDRADPVRDVSTRGVRAR